MAKNSWDEVDGQLNDHGEWLLVGAIACFSLPPIWCLVSVLTLLYVRAVRQESFAKQWKPNLLEQRLITNFSGEDFSENQQLQKQLKEDKPKRRISIF